MPRYNRAYETILARKLVARSNVGDDARVTEPLAFGSHKSALVAVIEGEQHRQRTKLSPEERLRLITWIDLNGPYHDSFINKRLPTPPYDLAADGELLGAIADVASRRCGACHEAGAVSRLDWVDLRDPRASRFLAGPLSAEAGGRGACGEPVYRDAGDPDYRALLERVEAAVKQAWERPRRDLLALVTEY
jgi:hypothetical protein